MKKISSPPDEACRLGSKVDSDDAYLENMASAIFRIGFSRQVVESKWPEFRRAFRGFSVPVIARFGPADVARLMEDRGIVRNQEKIQAVIDNARVMDGMRRSGAFRAFVLAILKTQGEEALVEELGRRFRRLGPMTSLVFLRMCGHEMPAMMSQRRRVR